MSKAAEKWAKQQGLRGFEHVVLMVLAKHYSPRWGMVKATQKQIADEAGISRQSVNSIIHRLEDKGLVRPESQERVKGQWDRVYYFLNPKRGGIQEPKKRPKAYQHRVKQPDTAPCQDDQTRHRVNLADTSRGDTTRARTLKVIDFPRQTAGGCQ